MIPHVNNDDFCSPYNVAIFSFCDVFWGKFGGYTFEEKQENAENVFLNYTKCSFNSTLLKEEKKIF